jgi:hypothetical protein
VPVWRVVLASPDTLVRAVHIGVAPRLGPSCSLLPRAFRGRRAGDEGAAPSNGPSLPLLLSSHLSLLSWSGAAAPWAYERTAFQAEEKRRRRVYPGFRREARLTPGYERTAFQAEENR